MTNPVRLQHLAGRVHALGERPLFELLRELEAGANMFDALERYAALNPATVRALGADRLPVDQVTVIDGGRR